jgi:hypothetical protein
VRYAGQHEGAIFQKALEFSLHCIERLDGPSNLQRAMVSDDDPEPLTADDVCCWHQADIAKRGR